MRNMYVQVAGKAEAIMLRRALSERDGGECRITTVAKYLVLSPRPDVSNPQVERFVSVR